MNLLQILVSSKFMYAAEYLRARITLLRTLGAVRGFSVMSTLALWFMAGYSSQHVAAVSLGETDRRTTIGHGFIFVRN